MTARCVVALAALNLLALDAAAQNLYAPLGGVTAELIGEADLKAPIPTATYRQVRQVRADGTIFIAPRQAYGTQQPQATCGNPSVAPLSESQTLALLPPSAPITVLTAPTPDGEKLFALEMSGNTVAWSTLDCAAGVVQRTDLGTSVLPVPADDLMKALDTGVFQAFALDANRVCFATVKGYECLTAPSGPGTPTTPEVLIDLAAIDEQVEWLDGYVSELVTEGQPGVREWKTGLAVAADDGRAFFIVELRWRLLDFLPLKTNWFPFVVERKTDGTLNTLMLPAGPRGSGRAPLPRQPIEFVTSMWVDPSLGALMLFPVVEDVRRDADERNYGSRSGIGAWAVGLTGRGNGYLSFTEAMLQANWCGQTPCAIGSNGPKFMCATGMRPFCTNLEVADEAIGLPGGGALVPRPHGDRVNAIPWGLYRLTFDADRLDIDRDGLDAALERSIGSNDYESYSDLVFNSDTIEHVLGTDPTDPLDDPSRGRRAAGFVSSDLIRRIMPPDFKPAIVQQVRPGHPSAPLCGDSECLLADRETRVRFAAEGETPQGWIAVNDPNMMVITAEDGLHRFSFVDGSNELLVPIAEINAVLDAGVLHVSPVDANQVWLWTEDANASPASGELVPLKVAVWTPTGGVELVYDHDQARCDSGLGPCAPPLPDWGFDYIQQLMHPHDLQMFGVRVVGYIGGLDRLVLAVDGTWNRYLVGLSATAEPAILARDAALPVQEAAGTLGLPEYFQQTGQGEWLWGIRVGSGSGGGGYDEFMRPIEILGSAYSDEHMLAFWGDILALPDGDSITELVRYTYGAERGDVVFVAAHDGINAQLFRSGPRGGLFSEWLKPMRNVWDVGGIDIRDDGMMCLADQGNGLLTVHEAYASSMTPQQLVAVHEGHNFIDCRWTSDGALEALVADPPQRLRWAAWDDEAATIEDLSAVPQGYARGTGGEVINVDDNLRGRLRLADGRDLTIAQGTWDIVVDGRTVGTLSGSAVAVDEHPENFLLLAELVERPDGLVVVQLHTNFSPGNQLIATQTTVFDPNTGEAWALSRSIFFPGNIGIGLAVIPGGVATDPWATGPPWSSNAPPTEEVEVPGPPVAPDGGRALEGEGGCCATSGSTPSSIGWLVALLGVLIRRR